MSNRKGDDAGQTAVSRHRSEGRDEGIAPGRRLPALAAVLLLTFISTAAPPVAAREAGPFDWTLGDWEGVRRDGKDGSEEPMTMQVEAILGGAGQQRHLEVDHSGGVYRGFSVQLYDPDLGKWVRQYANDVRGRFARLEGEVDGDASAGRSIWRSASPTRKRESQLVSERTAAGHWRRTMSVSEDAGASWRVLWTDFLEPRNEATESSPETVND